MKIATITKDDAYVMNWEPDEGTLAIEVLLYGYFALPEAGKLWLPTYD